MTRFWETIERVDTPDGALELKRRGTTDFLITIRGRILMTSVAHRSEDALARLSCEKLRDPARDGTRVLLSGLGMGFTLRAALDVLPPDARITVAELNPAVAAWCRGPLGPLTAHSLDDPRVTLTIADVSHVIAAPQGTPAQRFDAIVLDMYEGPRAARLPVNDPLYGAAALARTRAALRPGGVFAVWSEKPSAAFERELEATGFRVEKHRSGRGASVHFIYLGHTEGSRQSPHQEARTGRCRGA